MKKKWKYARLSGFGLATENWTRNYVGWFCIQNSTQHTQKAGLVFSGKGIKNGT